MGCRCTTEYSYDYSIQTHHISNFPVIKNYLLCVPFRAILCINKRKEYYAMKMSPHQIELINQLRIQGQGPTPIARSLDLPISTVASYIRRHPVPLGMTQCAQCHTFIPTTLGKRPRRFCSDACKTKWWNDHRSEGHKNMITITCQYCGKEFLDYENNQRKYCSKDCYHNARRNSRLQISMDLL